MLFEGTIYCKADSSYPVLRIKLESDALGWTVNFGIERGNSEMGLHTRSFSHAEVGGKNVAGVLQYALNQLDDPYATGAPDGFSASDLSKEKPKRQVTPYA
jgi:hypothetical protein